MALPQDLADIVGPSHVLTGDDTAPYAMDWIRVYPSSPLAVVRPQNTQQVAQIVRYANDHGVALVPMGGNTGLSGATQANGAVIVSLERMNAIHDIRPAARIAVVQAGAVLSQVHAAVDDHDMVFPVTFGARGSATIGGILSTNAGGSNVLRYGNTRDRVMGIEAVLPDGRVLNAMSQLHKDNSGYDLRHLLMGAEGTLGIITAAVLKLAPKPKAYATAMIAARSLSDALDVLNDLQDATGGGVEAFEYMPRDYVQAHLDHKPNARAPFDEMYDVNIMVEIATTVDDMARPNSAGQISLVSLLEHTLAQFLDRGAILDAVVAQNSAQRAEMWDRREAAAELTLRLPNLVNNDVAVPLDQVPVFLDRADVALRQVDPGLRLMVVSHLGDGNIHYAVSASTADPAIKDAIMQCVEDIVLDLGGSFSAEHGIGKAKLPSMRRRKDPVALSVMGQIKRALDPNNIMNPGKLLPDLD